MEERIERAVKWLLGPEVATEKHPGHLWPRWIFIRALGIFYFSAFYSLLFQIKGLIGPNGILPARDYLQAVSAALHSFRFWYAPTLFWFGAGDRALMFVCWVGAIASLLLVANVWPRASLAVSFVCFLSFISAAQDFSSYQSDGMLLEAGFIGLFFAPPGFWPGLARAHAPSRASLFLLRWEWFRIYFESGIVKLLSGDEEWRNFTAMDEYYQNGPLPTWIGWYVEHLPHWFHAATVVATLSMELAVVWMLFLPRRARLICFCIVTPWEICVIFTANYTFLNYLVLALGFLLLDDRGLRWLVPHRLRDTLPATPPPKAEPRNMESLSILQAPATEVEEIPPTVRGPAARFAVWSNATGLILSATMQTWIAYATVAELIHMPFPDLRLPSLPVTVLEPFRIANQYGLFAMMTRGRYEIEFQGSNDGKNWTPYLFPFKPQVLDTAPGIYAPYQPRFEWNLWFASLGDWQQNDLVPATEERLLENDPDVLALFQANPFGQAPPRYIRAVLWQYWFTSMDEKRRTGNWWRRELLGLYAPEIMRQPDGKFEAVEWPEDLPFHD
jgi:hypothetical protein